MGTVLNSTDFDAARNVKSATLTELGVVPICLAPGGEAFSHSHTMIEEVVMVHKGRGKIQIEEKTYDVCAGSVAIIPVGQYHALCNTGKKNLKATVVYNSNVNRERVQLKTREQHFGAEKQPSVGQLCSEIKALKKVNKKLKKKLK
ncbi:MAG: cupin domain-containing protein [Chromatiales bacterium]|jgi:mannose-6-phosphate isomerase-like protein (cupin superfamily)|nr:cupin domain-containing protein [Chromatiales bacterium]